MSRKKLSEYRAKIILNDTLGIPYKGLSIDTRQQHWNQPLRQLPDHKVYVIKVDQAVKGRFKKGLVKLGRNKTETEQDIRVMSKAGYSQYLVEPLYKHTADQECYFAISRVREGLDIAYSKSGGVDIETYQAGVQHLTYESGLSVSDLGVSAEMLSNFVACFNANHFSFLEINPLVISLAKAQILDAAVEVDEEAALLVDNRWTLDDLRSPYTENPKPEVLTVRELNERSQASFSLESIHPNGSIFLLLSGGGASVVLADEVRNLGLGEELGNYGEYSGNPNREEAAEYTRQVLGLLLASKARQKVLIIGGGVANFTDIRATFTGLIDALKELQPQLKRQKIAIYVRRGGPYEREGLQIMRDYLQAMGIEHEVWGPELSLTEIVSKAVAKIT